MAGLESPEIRQRAQASKRENSIWNFHSFRSILKQVQADFPGITDQEAVKAAGQRFSERAPSGALLYIKGRTEPYEESRFSPWAHGHLNSGEPRFAEDLIPASARGPQPHNNGITSPVLQQLQRIEEKLDGLLAQFQ